MGWPGWGRKRWLCSKRKCMASLAAQIWPIVGKRPSLQANFQRRVVEIGAQLPEKRRTRWCGKRGPSEFNTLNASIKTKLNSWNVGAKRKKQVPCNNLLLQCFSGFAMPAAKMSQGSDTRVLYCHSRWKQNGTVAVCVF